MQVKLLRKMQYENYFIHVLQFGHVFQYLFADSKGKNIYQNHIEFPPSFLNKIKHKLHLIPVPYTKEEMEAGEQIVLSGATKSIDALIEIEKAKKKEVRETPKEEVGVLSSLEFVKK